MIQQLLCGCQDKCAKLQRLCFKRPRIRGKQHEQDLISRTLSHCRSSEILLCFCWGILRHPGTKRSTLITWLWKEERRSGENSYFWHNTATEKRPHARVSSQNWASVFPVSYVCEWVGGNILCEYESEIGTLNMEREAEKKRKENAVLKEMFDSMAKHPCAFPLCNSASNVNRSVIRNSKHMLSWGRPLSFSLVHHTAHIMHCIKYLLVFVRLGLYFLHKNNQNMNRRTCNSLHVLVCSRKKWQWTALQFSYSHTPLCICLLNQSSV